MISSKWIITVYRSRSPFLYTLSVRQTHTHAHLRDNSKSAHKSPQCPTCILTLGEREFECVCVWKRPWEDEGKRWGWKTSWGRRRDSDVGSIATQKWSFFSPLCSLSLSLSEDLDQWQHVSLQSLSVECETNHLWHTEAHRYA